MTDKDETLPRGLVTRSGVQRLPSLKSDSKPLMMMTPPSTTKGGVTKRTFKPTIPVRRVNDETNNGNSDTKTQFTRIDRKRSHDSRQKQKDSYERRRSDRNKSFIQMDAAVFAGESTLKKEIKKFKNDVSMRSSPSSASTRQSSRNGNKHTNVNIEKSEHMKSDDYFSDKKLINKKCENKTADVIKQLYGENFIDDDDEDDDILFPKGWENVTGHCKEQKSQSILTPYNLLKNDDDDDDDVKYLVMQLPDLLLQKSDGFVGKMRVYKSGKIELFDNETGIKFNVMIDNKINSEVKSENTKMNANFGSAKEPLCEEIVTVEGNTVTSLGMVNHSQVLTVVPQIPIDD